jgi:hypothetical protein
MLAAVAFAEVAREVSRVVPAAPALLAVVGLGVLGLYGWQTWEQDQFIDDGSVAWRTLVTELDAQHLEFPGGSRVYVRGGPITEPLVQFAVMPAVGVVLWQDVELFTVPDGASPLCTRDGAATYVLDYDGGRFTSVAMLPATGDGRPYAFPPPVPAVCSAKVAVP